MVKVLFFSNYGNWDADAIGFIRAAEVVSLQATDIAQVASEIAASDTDDTIAPEVARNIKVIDSTRYEELRDELELSVHIQPDFDATYEAQVEGCIPMVIGVIVV